jgi:DNA replication protein DnaC
MGTRIAALLSEWKLPTEAGQLVHRLVAGGHDEALLVVSEVLELEAAGRKERRVERLRRASKLPPGKTFETLDRARVPRTALLKVQELSRGDFVEQANNVLLFGLPGVGKSHLACALGTPWGGQAGACFSRDHQLVQQLLVARRDLCLPRVLRALDVFDAVIPDDLGYVQQTAEEAEVLFTPMAEVRASQLDHHQQPGLQRVGPDLQDADGDGGSDRPARAPRGDHRDRAGERAGGGGEEAQRVEEEEGGRRMRHTAARRCDGGGGRGASGDGVAHRAERQGLDAWARARWIRGRGWRRR